MAEGILRGNKRVYNFSLDETADAELIEWLKTDVKVVSSTVRKALRQMKGIEVEESKEIQTQSLNTQNNDQMTQLIQLVQTSMQSNQQMFNTMLMMMQTQNQTQAPGIAPVQTYQPQMTQEALMGLLSSFTVQQQQQTAQVQQQATQAQEEQATALSEEIEEAEEEISEEKMLAAQQLVENSADPMESLEEWD